MLEPIPLSETFGILDWLDRSLAIMVRSAAREGFDAQVSLARVADIATKVRAAHDLSTYAFATGEIFEEFAAVFCGRVASEMLHLIQDFGPDYGLGGCESSPPEGATPFARRALADPRIRALGRRVATDRGRTEWLLEELLAITRQSVREFAETEIAPHAERIHRNNEVVPESFIEKMSELGYFGMSIPEIYGGSEMGNVAMVITTEELSRASLAAAGSLITRPEILSKALLSGGTEDQKRGWLPRIASGELMVGIAVTEPDVGSDVASVTCRATRSSVGGIPGWSITGPKAWCTFAGRADILAVLARTGPGEGSKGLSLFIVPKGQSRGHAFEFRQLHGGRIAGKADATPGYRGMHSFTLSFEDYFVPNENLVGGDSGFGRGFSLQMGGFAAGRLQTAARACGLAQAALEKTAEYVMDRRQFGRPLIHFDLTQYRLGCMACDIAAARAITHGAARAMDEDERRAAPYAAQAKLLACDVAVAVSQQGQLLHGGWGYAEEYPISRYVVDALVLPIFEGVKPILQLKVIGRALLAGEL